MKIHNNYKNNRFSILTGTNNLIYNCGIIDMNYICDSSYNTKKPITLIEHDKKIAYFTTIDKKFYFLDLDNMKKDIYFNINMQNVNTIKIKSNSKDAFLGTNAGLYFIEFDTKKLKKLIIWIIQ